MVCKETVNFASERKRREDRWRGVPAFCARSLLWGRAPGKRKINVSQWAAIYTRVFLMFGFPNRASARQWGDGSQLLGCNRSHGDYVIVQRACDRDFLASLFVESIERSFIAGRRNMEILSSTFIRANFDPWATQARVHSAADSPGMWFRPHMASPTSPVKLRLPAASAGRLMSAAIAKTNAATERNHLEPLIAFSPDLERPCVSLFQFDY